MDGLSHLFLEPVPVKLFITVDESEQVSNGREHTLSNVVSTQVNFLVNHTYKDGNTKAYRGC